MHILIGIFVTAPDEETAISFADRTAEVIVENCRSFDYFGGIGGPKDLRDRLTEKAKKPAFRMSEPEGKELVSVLMSEMKENFMEHLKKVRKKLSASDKTLWNRRDTWMFHANQLGEYEGPSVKLYNEDGCGISGPDALKEFMAAVKAKEFKAKDEDVLWIVPVDMHY